MKVYITIFLLALIYDLATVGSLKPTDIRHHLGSRTPYRFRANKNDSRIKYPNCKDTKIWMLIRHGTRLPSHKDIEAALELVELKYEILLQHEFGKGELNKEQLQKLHDWTIDLDINKERFLTVEGQDEMILMAERMQKRFPNAIKPKYSNKTFLFQYTATQRAQQSARYFTNGLFEKKDSQDVIFAPATKVDLVLRFYKHCVRYQKQVKNNPETYKELNLFGTSHEMINALKSVSNKLGLNRVLKLETVDTLYKFCGYETSWDKYHISPWCHAFDEKSIEAFEYYHDLKTYWVDGYGHELTYRQACISIKNMFDIFSWDSTQYYAFMNLDGQSRRAESLLEEMVQKTFMPCKEDGPRSIFMFSHSGTLLKILTHLNLYQPPSPLSGDGIMKDREWKLSNIDCFAANLAFVLFKCDDGDHILTLHQEKIIKLPMCEQELCPLKHIKEQLNETIFNCDYTDMCSLERNFKSVNTFRPLFG